jgi:hypothetical protein
MRFLLRLIVFAGLVLVGVWFYQDWRARHGQSAGSARAAGGKVPEIDLKLDVDSLKDELQRTGRIVRRKTAKAAEVVAEATEDVRTTAAIKARLALDPQLSAIDIGVHTSNGTVTLSGTVDSPERLAKLVRLVLEHDGVEEVVSTVHVRAGTT